MLKLQRVKSQKEFFSHKQLFNIWPKESTELMKIGTIICLQRREAGLYFIMLNDNVIGITGFFNLEKVDKPINIGLRWHGIIKSKRNQGLSRQVLKMVIEKAKKKYPTAKYLCEFVPMIEYSGYIVDHFENLGFKKQGKLQKFYWSKNKMQNYKLKIN